VKPIHLNLASRPYRDYRPVYAVVVLLSLLTAFLMETNIETYYRYIHETQATRGKIAELEEQTKREHDRDEMARQRLKGLDLARLSAQTKFINAKLAERAFSWSRLLDALEAVLADDVRLISVAPSFDANGRIDLSLDLQSKSPDGMITTINRMNADPRFAGPFPNMETQMEGGLYSFRITAQYRPQMAGEVVR
jgi:hypothetical protein